MSSLAGDMWFETDLDTGHVAWRHGGDVILILSLNFERAEFKNVAISRHTWWEKVDDHVVLWRYGDEILMVLSDLDDDDDIIDGVDLDVDEE